MCSPKPEMFHSQALGLGCELAAGNVTSNLFHPDDSNVSKQNDTNALTRNTIFGLLTIAVYSGESRWRCVKECAEGALGFVVNYILPTILQPQVSQVAPRLIGETHRENAYISERKKEPGGGKWFHTSDGTHIKSKESCSNLNLENLLNADTNIGSPLFAVPFERRAETAEAQNGWSNYSLCALRKGKNPLLLMRLVKQATNSTR